MKALITPLINLNGNTADDLLDKLKTVLVCTQALSKAMMDAADIAHGRNFQTHSDPFGARSEAYDAWRERQVMIANLEDEVRALAMTIYEQKRS